MKFDRSKFIGKFTQEATELVQKLNDALVRLEKTPQDQDVLKEILRVTHTLKGSSKIMRFHRISQLAHKMEDVLIGVQDGQMTFTANLLDLLFRSTDVIAQLIRTILHTTTEEAVGIESLCAAFDAAVQGEDFASMLTAPSQKVIAALDTVTVRNGTAHEVGSAPASLSSPAPEHRQADVEETIRIGVARLDNVVRLIGEVAVSHKRSERMLHMFKELRRSSRKHAKQLHQLFQENLSPETHKQLEQNILTESTQLLKRVESIFKEHRDELAMLDLVISELYEDVLNMCMLPLSVIFETFPRAVRDMSKSFGKQVDIHITGEETMLDKKIIESLNAPLIHLLRNCADHGIETPEERIAHGKSRTGRITITAAHISGRIHIEIHDDGRGVQCEKLVRRAVQRGMLSEEHAESLSHDEAMKLVFLPRLSTSDIITDISGRGMGMDIVKAGIEQLKGTISLESRPGLGTTYLLTLPTTLTTIRGLLVAAQGKQFAAPINAIEDTLQISPHECIQVVGQTAIRLRNQIIYVVELADLLGLPKLYGDTRSRFFVLIIRVNGKRVGLIVDEILDEQDMIVKQLPPHLRKVKTIVGATISSENKIILILHIPEIIELVKLTTLDLKEQQAVGTVVPPKILIVDDSANTGEIEKRILETYGYTIDLARDGVEALEFVDNAAYDLIITDVEMPRMDGFTLTEHLRNLPRYEDIPIVIVTSLERESDKKRGLQVGANAYITKGDFEQRSLIETVRSLV